MPNLDLGEPTEEVADLSAEQLDAVLSGTNTTELDAAAEKEYGAYLDQWASSIRQAFDGLHAK